MIPAVGYSATLASHVPVMLSIVAGPAVVALVGATSTIGFLATLGPVVAATANFAPGLVVGIYESFVKGDIRKAREFQFKLFPFRLAFNLGTFPVVVKEAMELIGRPSGPARSPVRALSQENREKLKNLLIEGGLLQSPA